MKRKANPIQIECLPLKEIQIPLLLWYRQNARELPWRSDPSPYRVWVSEIMLQQTRVEAVKPYFARFMEELPTVEALSRAEDDKLLKLWEGLGYYSRVRNLRRAAQVIMADCGGRIPSSPEELKKLPGIGSYTAGAIASIAYGAAAPAVDGNVLRVVSRVLRCYENIDLPPVRRAVEEALQSVMPKERPGDYNQALMELGATVCLPNGAPKCMECPLRTLCRAKTGNVISELPVRSEKKKRRAEDLTVFVFIRETSPGKYQTALRRRPGTGLLAGLWEFPHTGGTLNEEEAAAVPGQWGIKPLQLLEKRTAKHIFTHIEWHMTGYLWKVEAGENTPFTWADSGALSNIYAVPNAFSAFLEAARGYLPPEEPLLK